MKNLWAIHGNYMLKKNMDEYYNPYDYWPQTGYDPYKGMTDNERLWAACVHVAGYIMAIGIMLLLCALFGSCTTTKYVPVIETHTDTLIQTRTQYDSIYLSDSIYISDFVRTDTVFRTVERWHTQYRDRWQHDTIYKSRTDSVPAPVPTPVEVPAKLTWWQQTRLHLANIVLWLLALMAVIYVGKKHLVRLRQD